MINWLIYLVCVAIGFLLGLLFTPVDTSPATNGFVFSKEINITELLSVFMPILIGLLVALYFQKPTDRKLRIREALVNRIHEVDQYLVETLEAARCNNLTYLEAASASKKCTSRIVSVCTKLLDFGLLPSDSTRLRDIQVALHSMRIPLTDIPSNDGSEVQAALTVSGDGVCTYTKSRLMEIEMRIDNVRNLILKLELDVNDNT